MDETVVYDAAWGDAQCRLYLESHGGKGGEYHADLDHLMQELDQVPDADIMILLNVLGLTNIHTGGMSNRYRLRRWLDKASRLPGSATPRKREEVPDDLRSVQQQESAPAEDVGDAGSAPL